VSLALRLRDQGWRGLLPILPPDAAPARHLPLDKAEEIIKARGKGPGRHVGAGRWAGLADWRAYPDDEATIARWGAWPGVNIGLRACHEGSGIAFLDADILDLVAAGEVGALIRGKLGLDAPFRVRRWPKVAFPVRVLGTLRKADSPAVLINDQRCRLEVAVLRSGYRRAALRPAVTAAGLTVEQIESAISIASRRGELQVAADRDGAILALGRRP
jgi:hypothetical protein